MVNYPTEWWHWSFGERYWAFVTGAGRTRYAPVRLELPVRRSADGFRVPAALSVATSPFPSP
jgi:hypothetical protein